MKFRKVIESGIITAALAVSSVTTAVSASAAEVDTTGVVGSVLDRASQIASTGIRSVQIYTSECTGGSCSSGPGRLNGRTRCLLQLMKTVL